MRPPVFFLFLLAAFASVNAQTHQNLEGQLPSLRDTARVNALNKLAREYSETDSAKSLRYSGEALQLAQNLDYYQGVAVAMRLQGLAYYFSSNHMRFIELAEQSAAYATEHRLWPLVSENYESIAAIYSTVFSNQTLSLQYYFKAYEVYEKYNPAGAMYTPLVGISSIYKKQSQYDKALEYISRAMPLIEKANDRRNMAVAFENLAQVYWLKHDLIQSKINYQKSLDLFKEVNRPGGQIFALIGLANISREEGDLTGSMALGKQALRLSEQYTQYDRAKLYGLESVAKTYLAQKNYKEAQVNFQAGLSIATRFKMTESIRDFYKQLAYIANAEKDYQSAYKYQTLFSAYADSALNKEMSNQLTEAQGRFESERKEAEIEILKRDNQISKFNFIISMASLLGVVIFGYLIITRQRLKNQKDREIAAVEHERLKERRALVEVELKNKELSEAKLRDQLEFRSKELTTYTLNLIQKNETMENLKNTVEEMKHLPDNEMRSRLNGLINTVNFSFNLDRDWENFKLHFEEVHNDFFQKLLKDYPDLNSSDLKLCALMKLNMDTKEIATVIDISPESIKVARHRLRKKLNMATEQNLSSFLAAY
jgi:DNA-binding CsgD family transcriptional regulator